LPVYNKLIPENISLLSGITNLKKFTWSNLKHVNEDCGNCLIPLIETINEWSERFNLSDEWIKDILLLHLPYWRGFPPEKELS